MKKNELNSKFYANCSIYFDALKKSGKSDDEFEDEYFLHYLLFLAVV